MIWNHDLKSFMWFIDLDLNHLYDEDLDFDLKSNFKQFWSWNHFVISVNHLKSPHANLWKKNVDLAVKVVKHGINMVLYYYKRQWLVWEIEKC